MPIRLNSGGISSHTNGSNEFTIRKNVDYIDANFQEDMSIGTPNDGIIHIPNGCTYDEAITRLYRHIENLELKIMALTTVVEDNTMKIKHTEQSKDLEITEIG